MDGVIPLRRRVGPSPECVLRRISPSAGTAPRLAVLRIHVAFPNERFLRSMLTMYSTTWCGHCVRLKRGLKAAGIGFDEVNIEEDAAGAELVMDVNGGNMTVPTVVFSDGTALTNPALDQVQARLAKAG
jgi:mycoredoxin